MPGQPSYSRAPWNDLRRIQVADPMIADGLKGRGAVFGDVERDLFRLSYATVDSPYPFLLMIPQSQTQRHLDQRFAELGGSLFRGVRLARSRNGISRKRCHRCGFHRRTASYQCSLCCRLRRRVLRVRSELGIGFPGTSPEQMFAVSDVRFEGWPRDGVETVFSLSPQGMLVPLVAAARRYGARGGIGGARNASAHRARRH